jgi:hypothetical protein
MGKDKRKPLVELDQPNGNIIMYWESGKDASLFYGISKVIISMCLTGRLRHAKKKYFRFATAEEIASYRNVKERLSKNIEPVKPPEKVIDIPNITVETIPEIVEKPQAELTPFDRLIQKGKEKLI